MVRLSVNVNKVATLRNARGRGQPNLLEAVDGCVRAGAHGITVHPRTDARHVTYSDVRDVARHLSAVRPRVEFNVEGDPLPDWLELVRQVRPEQATLVPVRPGELTSEAGWGADTDWSFLAATVASLRRDGIRVSLFVEADVHAVERAHAAGADRVELYTEPFATAFERGSECANQALQPFREAAMRAHQLGMGVNAGHDLNLDNLGTFRNLPHLDEVSIGHALISRALFIGLEPVVGEYLRVLAGNPPTKTRH